MRYVLLTLSSLLLFLFIAGSLAPEARPARADNPNTVCADFDDDGQVGISDIGLVVRQFGTTEESAEWDPRFDVNGDGIVATYDVGFTAAQFGDICTTPLGKISFETITKNIGGGIVFAPPGMRVARTEEEWDALWEEHVEGRLPLPPVNFEEEMVVGVFYEAPSSGYFLNIDGFNAGEEEWVARATLLRFCAVLPMFMIRNHIVRVQRTELPVRLELREYNGGCLS